MATTSPQPEPADLGSPLDDSDVHARTRPIHAVSVSADGLTVSADRTSHKSDRSASTSAIDDRHLGDAGDSTTPKWLGKKIGRFRLLSLLGEGSWGRVFEAEDGDLRRRVALKVIRARDRKTGVPNAVAERVIREARAAARLTHPHVVQVYEVGEDQNLVYIAMELIDGGTLRDLVKSGGPMDAARACAMAADAADALGRAHSLGVVHRDVKPGNLMLSRTGRCMLADFGLATIDDPNDSHRYSRTAGTPHFVAPEIVRGNPADARSDIYSLGATLFYLLTGRPPFAEAGGDGSKGNRDGVLRAHLDRPAPDLRKLRPDLDPGLCEIVAKALAKDPSKRFQKAEQLAAAVRQYTISLPPAPVVPLVRGTRWLGLGLTMAISTLAAALAAAALWISVGDPDAITQPPVRTEADRQQAEARIAAAPAPLLDEQEDSEESEDRDDPTGIAEFAPEDKAELIKHAADEDNVAVVEGRVTFAEKSSTGRVFRVGFEGVDTRDGFHLVWFPDEFDAFEEAFGGEAGSDLRGQTIRVRGTVTVYRNNPQMVLTRPSQITIVGDD
jgi:hypothetical protein